MKFTLKNIGPIKHHEVELGKLTVVSGKNNTGKTYLSYSIFGFLSKLQNHIVFKNFKSFNRESLINDIVKGNTFTFNIEQLEKELFLTLKEYYEEYDNIIHKIFNANKDEFIDSSVRICLEVLNAIKESGFGVDLSSVNGRIAKEKKSSEVMLILENGKSSFNDDHSYQNIEKENSKVTPKGWENLLSFNEIKVEVLSLFFWDVFEDIFLLSAERTSLQTYQKELDQYKNKLIKQSQENRNFDILDTESRFSFPVEEHFEFIRNSDKIIKHSSFLENDAPYVIDYIEGMFDLEYEFINDQLMVNVGDRLIPHYMSSSSVRSLADLHVWLKHKATPGSLLMIDEPELNLHPENQVKMARLFARLINAGVNVFITTHSDYILKELNNLLLLSNDFEGKPDFVTEFGYHETEILKKEDVRIYITKKDGTIKNVEIGKLGFAETTFDDTIESINEVSNSLFNILNQ